MNKATRMLVMTGMAIVAGATFSAGPAMAASASPAPSTHKVTTQGGKDWGHDRSQIIRYYSNPFTCNREGRLGKWRHRWDGYNCFRVPFGVHRGAWALRVTWNRPSFPGHGHGFPGHGHGFPGGPGHHGHHPGGHGWTKH